MAILGNCSCRNIGFQKIIYTDQQQTTLLLSSKL